VVFKSLDKGLGNSQREMAVYVGLIAHSYPSLKARKERKSTIAREGGRRERVA
jgi:hypothetical protein